MFYQKKWQQNDNNLNIIFITERGEDIYKVFSVYQIMAENYYVKAYSEESEFKTFVGNLKNRSVYDFSVEIKLLLYQYALKTEMRG